MAVYALNCGGSKQMAYALVERKDATAAAAPCEDDGVSCITVVSMTLQGIARAAAGVPTTASAAFYLAVVEALTQGSAYGWPVS